MARDGSGNYSLPAGNPVVTGSTISSTTHNNTMSDIATALTQSVSKDGQTAYTGNQPMGSNKLTGLSNGSARTDSIALGQVQDSSVCYLTSPSGTNTITASLTSLAAYAAGQCFRFIAAATNTGAVTLNVNSLGAKSITKFGAVALDAGDIISGQTIEVIYDGTQFQIVGPNRAVVTFSANKNGTDQTAITGTTKVTFGTEDWDIGAAFASSTWTPPAGKYDINAAIGVSSIVDQTAYGLLLYKNGALHRQLDVKSASGTATMVLSGSAVVDANGTDTFEIYVSGLSSGTVLGNTASTYFQGAQI